MCIYGFDILKLGWINVCFFINKKILLYVVLRVIEVGKYEWNC